jgi:hypothetical protein
VGREEKIPVPDTGKLAYRNPEFEPYPDERPVIYDRFPFWRDEDERIRYERAAKHMPVSQYGHLTAWQYMAAIAEVANGLKPGGPKGMPKLERVR